MPEGESQERGVKRKAGEVANAGDGSSVGPAKRPVTVAAVTACGAARVQAQMKGKAAAVDGAPSSSAGPAPENSLQAASHDGYPAHETAPASRQHGGMNDAAQSGGVPPWADLE